jgi:hypothetical protein
LGYIEMPIFDPRDGEESGEAKMCWMGGSGPSGRCIELQPWLMIVEDASNNGGGGFEMEVGNIIYKTILLNNMKGLCPL